LCIFESIFVWLHFENISQTTQQETKHIITSLEKDINSPNIEKGWKYPMNTIKNNIWLFIFCGSHFGILKDGRHCTKQIVLLMVQ
jgi:hypothetical protein